MSSNTSIHTEGAQTQVGFVAWPSCTRRIHYQGEISESCGPSDNGIRGDDAV